MFFSMPVCRKPMPGRMLFTVSPSHSTIRRSTPWVEGCWGPMLMTRVSSLRSACSRAIWSKSPPPMAVYTVPTASSSGEA